MRKSVWVIDDDEIYQTIIKKMMSQVGAFDDEFYYLDASKALEDLTGSRAFLPDVILLDINMPQMDGWQFIEELDAFYGGELYKRTRIFIVSSSIANSDKERAEDFPGISGFLTKPVSRAQLKEIGESINKNSGVGTGILK